MSLNFAYFFEKDLRAISLPRRVDRAARYMYAPLIESLHSTWMNIIHFFLVVYTNCRRPRDNCGHNYRIQAVIRNVECLDIEDAGDGFNNNEDDDAVIFHDAKTRKIRSGIDISKPI